MHRVGVFVMGVQGMGHRLCVPALNLDYCFTTAQHNVAQGVHLDTAPSWYYTQHCRECKGSKDGPGDMHVCTAQGVCEVPCEGQRSHDAWPSCGPALP